MLEERKGKVAKHGVPYSEFVLCISPIQEHYMFIYKWFNVFEQVR